VYEDKPDGPFRLSDQPLPKGGYILSKSHCGGYCFSDCPPNWFKLTPQKFLNECTTGARFDQKEDGTSERTWTHYDPSIVKKVVHLFRDPFDNIISRFNHECKLNMRKPGTVKWINDYNNDVVGFNNWCKDSDERHKESAWFDATVLEAFKGVPCHGEFFRYAQWHNNAFITAHFLGIPTHVVHYRDFHDDAKFTLHGILQFLEQPKKNSRVPPFSLKTYKSFYSPDDKMRISSLIKILAIPETWEHLKRYGLEKYVA